MALLHLSEYKLQTAGAGAAFLKPAFAVLSARAAERALSANPAIVALDARSPFAFWRGHLPGALNITMKRHGSEHPLPLPAGVEVLVYDESGGESAIELASELIGQVRKVWLLDGGLQAWANAGFPVARPKQDMPPAI